MIDSAFAVEIYNCVSSRFLAGVSISLYRRKRKDDVYVRLVAGRYMSYRVRLYFSI